MLPQGVKSVITSSPGVDYWEGYNEPGCANEAEMRWLAAFEVERVRLLSSLGLKASVGEWHSHFPFLPALQP